ncbi:MAG TPA: CcdB family protein [Acetobacteraceae bacterium]|nr:CcdB family protein [Acetobacteraceae bacterium]
MMCSPTGHPGHVGRFHFWRSCRRTWQARAGGRIVAPLVPRTSMQGAAGRLFPIVRHDNGEFRLVLELMTSVPHKELRHRLGAIAAYRDDITCALDWLFTGV